MKRRWQKGLGIALVVTVAALTAGLAGADEPAWGPPDGLGEGPPGRHVTPQHELTRLHMELGHYYLLSGAYAQAAEHFVAVTQTEVDEPGPGPRGVERADDTGSPDGRDAVEGRRGHHRRGHGPRGGHGGPGLRTRAYLMAAVSLYLSGDEGAALAIATEGQALIDARRGDDDGAGRPSPLDRFIGDPATASARFMGGVGTLEERIVAIESELGDNVSD